ncbi:MAG: hypothetical protein EOP06_08805 [Proteobacteria bacterium]|nr:MAG: hypothetical protein EOP06_08805 [Pseudomonadota bacterium]
MAKPTNSYRIGYAKPPEATQFKKGTSGNPKGRPKGSKDLNSMISQLLNTKIEVTDAWGRKKRLTKLEAIFTQLLNRALKGDHRAVKEVLALAPQIEQVQAKEVLDANEVRQALLARLLSIKERRAAQKSENNG